MTTKTYVIVIVLLMTKTSVIVIDIAMKKTFVFVIDIVMKKKFAFLIEKDTSIVMTSVMFATSLFSVIFFAKPQ